jgi:pyrroloquinoline-quinone synthase
MPLWVDFQVSWKWRLSQVGSFAENSAAVAFAEEGPFPEQCGKVRDGLKKHYGVEDERLLDFFTVHMMADEQHKEYGRQILLNHANTPELQRKALAAARRNLTLMLKIHDEVDSGDWTV